MQVVLGFVSLRSRFCSVSDTENICLRYLNFDQVWTYRALTNDEVLI